MRHRRIALILSSVAGLLFAATPHLQPSPPPVIEIWYGPEQRFGEPGLPQRFVNVLGNLIWYGHGDIKLHYSLNRGPWLRLARGPDANRLVAPGDFNIEIDSAELLEGDNDLLIRARYDDGREVRRHVRLHFTGGRSWPMPYRVEFANAKGAQIPVQIVDGRWSLVDGGLRTQGRGYDRVISFGDMDWTDYEVTTEFTIHDFTPPHDGPPSWNSSHLGIGLRWKGHHDGGDLPRTKWYPIGVAAEFTLDVELTDCRWRLLRGDALESSMIVQANGQPFVFGKRYLAKVRVTTSNGPSSIYQAKLWPAAEPEPPEWNIEDHDAGPDYRSGSVVVAAHHTDVTLWNLQVTPINDIGLR